MAIESLRSHDLSAVLEFLETPAVICLKRASKATHATVDSCEGYWRIACRRDWAVPQTEAAPVSWRQLWDVCCNDHGPETLACMPRAARWWRRLEQFAVVYFPPLLATLNPPATAESLRAAELAAGILIPPALRALYLCHDGQHLGPVVSVGTLLAGATALFGGMFVYDSVLMRRFVPVAEAAATTAVASATLLRPIAHRSVWSLTGPSRLSEGVWVSATGREAAVFVEDRSGALAPAGTARPGL